MADTFSDLNTPKRILMGPGPSNVHPRVLRTMKLLSASTASSGREWLISSAATGVRQPLERISRLVHENGALFLVDTVSSLGGCPVEVDKWKIDACECTALSHRP